jgi:hypothetical protein
VARLLPQAREERLQHPVHVLGCNERRFDIDLGELRLPVGPQILVPETAGQLEVPIEPRHHEKLLVELGRLRQRIELAAVHP